MGSAVFSLPLFDTLALAFELPVTLFQTRRDDIGIADGVATPLGSLQSAGLGDLRLAAKVQLLHQNDYGIDLALMPSFSIPLGDVDSYLRERAVTFAPEVLLSRSAGAFSRGAQCRLCVARRNPAAEPCGR